MPIWNLNNTENQGQETEGSLFSASAFLQLSGTSVKSQSGMTKTNTAWNSDY